MTPSFNLTLPREAQPQAVGTIGDPTDIELMLALWRNPRTKVVALEMADRNRAQAQEERK